MKNAMKRFRDYIVMGCMLTSVTSLYSCASRIDDDPTMTFAAGAFYVLAAIVFFAVGLGLYRHWESEKKLSDELMDPKNDEC